MIDFRYHLISIMAVILALALGVVVGSGFIGGPLLDRLKSEVDDLSERNEERLDRIDALERAVEQSEVFARLAAGYLVDRSLAGSSLVVFELGGSDGGLVDAVKREIEGAGAEISTEITIAEKFALTTDPVVDELALALGSTERTPQALRLEAVALLGDRASAVASGPSEEDAPSGAAARWEELVDSLARAEFIGVRTSGDGPTVPRGASFVVIGGSEEEPPYEAAALTIALVEGLAARDTPTVLVESQLSSWDLTASVRQDVEARDLVVTVDNGENTIGGIAVVLGLEQAQNGRVGHFGFGAGSTAVIPTPVPNP